jgi:hypothetical protein
MGQVLLTRSREPEFEEIEGQKPCADFYFGGIYFFLYPEILRLSEQTGELIDPQKDAFFYDSGLDLLEQFAVVARERTNAQPEYLEQHVSAVFPSGEPAYQRTIRADVLDFLDRLTEAIKLARHRGLGVFFLGDCSPFSQV